MQKYRKYIIRIAAMALVMIYSWLPAGAQQLAFPGAEGFGKYTTGGRGGRVIVVTNLEDDGPGSFRKAAIANGKRIIVFAVSGTIHLKSKLVIKGDVTIAGQTAPGDGICLADHSTGIGGDNVIIRYLRFRMGDRYQNAGKVPGSGHDDVFSASRKKNIIIDHCSFSWSTDEVISVYNVDSTTLQWNIIAEPLNYSYHFEEGDTDFENHGYGGIWGGTRFSAYYNLIAHCNSRTPRFNGVRLGAETELADFRNNLIYNWGHNNIYGGEGGTYNLVNNYFKYGPDTKKGVRYRIVNPNRNEKNNTPFGKYYVEGNYVDGAPDVSRNNWPGIHMGNKGTEADKQEATVKKPLEAITIPGEKAAVSYEKILLYSGASLPVRDTLDARIAMDVRNRTGRIIDVQGGYPHGTPYEKTVNAWPSLRSAAAPPDSDGDGMPDAWETKHGLNPNDAKDASLFTLDKHYTNIEMYINALVPASQVSK
ncbi:MAG TPA: pectate lyase [Chitinophagaceae bacterium]|nr:pectate lyase [Chitinophagaceae bacterium]